MIEEVFRKLAENLPLQMQRELRSWAVNVDRGFGSRSGARSWSFDRLSVDRLVPRSTLLYPFVAEKVYHATDTLITDDTFTYVTFNQNKYGDNDAFQLDADNQRVFINTRAKAFYAGLAHAWEAHATGRRRADFEYYDSTDSLLGTALLSVEQGFAGDENWYAPSRLADLPDDTSYIKCRVKHTAGTDIHLVYFALDLHIV